VLEWLKNNSTIKKIISEEMEKIQKFVKENPQSLENNGNLMKIKSFDLRNKWIKSNAASDYHQMYIKVDENSAVTVFNQIDSMIPYIFFCFENYYF
jgi:hypothetical protein